jgi:integrase/recombinase XerD
LARTTVVNYLSVVAKFLDEHFANKAMRLRDLAPRDLNRFILREAQRVSRRRAKVVVTALRSFLRFLQQRGSVKVDLAASLSGLAIWRLSDIPKSLAPVDVDRVLQSCDRNTASGQRDHAILLLFARLGLRSGEVLSMTLDDFDWKKGEVLVRGKGQRFERLPLPKEVGAAIVCYLRNVRPSCSTRRVFIRLKAPWRPICQGTITSVVHSALRRNACKSKINQPALTNITS